MKYIKQMVFAACFLSMYSTVGGNNIKKEETRSHVPGTAPAIEEASSFKYEELIAYSLNLVDR